MIQFLSFYKDSDSKMNDSNIKEIQEDSNSKIQSMIQTDFDSKLPIRTQPWSKSSDSKHIVNI